MIDEYAERGENATRWFSIASPPEDETSRKERVLRAVNFVLSAKTAQEWTHHTLSDLIQSYCMVHREPRSILFGAIRWLRRHRPDHVVLVPTPRSVATLTASSASREHIELKRYYQDHMGRFISALRIHQDAEFPSPRECQTED